jgi:autotransporter-associated beta strand protein/T5SS/PEP-CTERM-associated repeat protein
MRSYRWRSQATRAAAPAAPGAALRDSAIWIAPPAARVAFNRAALLGSVWLGALAMLAPNTAQATDGTWIGGGAPVSNEWFQGNNWNSTPTPNTVPDITATFTNNGAPTLVTISTSTSINTIEFAAAAPAYSFTVQNGATFTITGSIINNPSLEPAFTVNALAALTIDNGGFAEIGSLAGGGTVTIGPSSSSAQLSIVGPSSTTFSGTLAGAGTLELDNGTLTLTGLGSSIGGLNICNCDTNGLIISGGSLNVTDPGLGTVVEGGTLSVINGGTLQTTNLAVVISSAMLISGPGSTVTVNPAGLTEIGALVGPTSLTIANGGVLTSLGGAAIDSGSPNFASTVTVTGAGSTWNVGVGLAVGGGGTFGGPGILTISNGGAVNATGLVGVGDPTGNSTLTVTGAGSTLTVLSALLVGDTTCACGPLIGTLTVADGGVVNSPGFTGIAQGSTLNLGIGGLAGAIVTPAIVNDGQIAANFTDTLTLAAAISGAGALSKAGAGTLILTGSSTYTGGTTITGGTLQLGNGGASGSIAGDVVNNGTFAINRSDTFAFGGVISGSGAFAQIGPGTTILTAANTYAGGTAINGGVLAVAADANLGAASGGLVFGGGTLQFLSGFTTNRAVTLNAGGGAFDTNGNSATLGGGISSSGGLTKLGAGTLTLSGASSYSGATAVNAGTLQAGAANTFASGSAFTVASGATLDLNGFSQTVGSLAGAGNVTLGAATLTTGTDNTSTTFSGTISGTGGLTKIGAGTLVLTGTNPYSGATAVNGGRLTVNGAIPNSTLTVNGGATLGGTGTIGNAIINNGTLSPGNSIGTITVNGNLVMTAAASYLVEISPTNADRTNVGGTATLAGTVQAVFAAGSYVTRAYTILSAAGGRIGTFNALTTTNLPANFTASLSYTATDAILNLTAALGGLTALGVPNAASGAGAFACAFNVNQCNVANALNAFFNNGGTLPPAFASIFGLTGVNLGNALTLLSGEAATGGQQAAFQLTNQFLGVMLDPFVDGRNAFGGVGGGGALGFAPEREELPDDIALAYAKLLKAPPKPATFEQRWSVWGAGYGGGNRTSGDPAVVGSHDLSARTAGGAAGLDYHLSRDSVVGVALAGGGTDWSLAQGLGGGKSDAFQAGIYGATRWGAAYVAAALAFTNHWMSTDRFAFAGDHLSASFNAQSFGGRVEGGYRFATLYGGLTPYAAVQAQNFRTPAYSEADLNAGGFALGYNGRTATDTRSELGGRFDRLLLLNPEAALTLRARVAWAHDWVSDPTLAAVFQALPGASFLVNGATPAKNSALTSAGAELRLANGVSLLAKFDGEFASHSSTYAGTGTVRYTW